MKKVLLVGTLLLGSVLSPQVGHASEEIKTFKNCKELNAVYKDGVRKDDKVKNKVVKKDKSVEYKDTKATVNKKLYEANIKLDNDKDGIACEK